MTDPERQSIGKALGRIPSGVFILTVTRDGHSSAMLASWVQQVSFAPPAVAFAVAADRAVRRLITDGSAIALSVLGNGDHALMKKYARSIPEGQDPFEGVATAKTPSGAVYLTGAAAWLEGRFLRELEFNADHVLYVMEVTAGAQLKDDPPFTHVRRNGFHY